MLYILNHLTSFGFRDRANFNARALEHWLLVNYVQHSEDQENEDVQVHPYDDELDDAAVEFISVEDSENETSDNSDFYP